MKNYSPDTFISIVVRRVIEYHQEYHLLSIDFSMNIEKERKLECLENLKNKFILMY